MQKGIIFGIIAIVISIGYVAYSEFPQQTATAQTGQRVFTHAQDLLEALDNAQYMDGSYVQSSALVPVILVENWDAVTVADKAAIRSQATIYGYQEIIP